MKKWIIPGAIMCLLLVGTLVLLGAYFFSELSAVFSPEAMTQTAHTDTFGDTGSLPDTTALPNTTLPQDTTEQSDPTTVPDTTVPEDTTVPGDTTVSISTVTTSQPTVPLTTAPPETTVPPQTTVPVTTAPPQTTPPATTVPPETTQPGYVLTAKHAFVYDCVTGEYLYIAGDINEQISFASITKLFTAYVALQHLSPDTVVTVGEEVNWIDPESSRAWIYAGQQLTAETLVAGMLIPSGNDAAYAIAVAAGRAVKGDAALSAQDALAAFIAEMNAQAQKLGLTGSHFSTPDGIDAEDHYSTMSDLRVISCLALENATIRKYAAMPELSGTYVSGQTYKWRNSNYLVRPDSEYYCREACGLKTGNTAKAGKCQITAFQKGDSCLLIGVFGCTSFDSRAEDTLYLYEQCG